MSIETDVAAKEVLAGLRAALDPDTQRAARKYGPLRRKLVSFFEWSGAKSPDACADETLTATAWKLTDGEPLQSLSICCAAIARTILHKQVQTPATSGAATAPPPSPNPFGDLEGQLNSFQSSLDALPADSRDLLLTFYAGADPKAIDARQKLSERLGIPLNQMRLRAHRTRTQLEQSVMGTEPSSGGAR